MNADELRLKPTTERSIGCAFTIDRTLGPGFVEKVYENALVHDLRKTGLSVVQQRGISIYYDRIVVGEFVADLLVENEILIEVKAVRAFDDVHSAQCLNYLKGTGLHLCLLINFGNARVEIKRIVSGL